MSVPIYGGTPGHGRDAHATSWNAHAIVARATHVAASAAKESREIMFTLAGTLAIVMAGLALDVWLWVPRSGH